MAVWVEVVLVYMSLIVYRLPPLPLPVRCNQNTQPQDVHIGAVA